MSELDVIVLRIRPEQAAEYERLFVASELPRWRDYQERGLFISARMSRVAFGTEKREDIATYVIAVEVPRHEQHSAHDADPGFQQFNQLADAFQPEEPLVFGGEVIHSVGPASADGGVHLTPVLNVSDADEAVAFYRRAFDAREIHRNTYPDGRAVVEMSIDRARFRVAGVGADATNPSPETLGGTSVRINLLVSDPDAVSERALASGARLVAPIADQPYGLRQGGIVDPFGHHWLIGRPLAGRSGDWARISG